MIWEAANSLNENQIEEQQQPVEKSTEELACFDAEYHHIETPEFIDENEHFDLLEVVDEENAR